MYIYIYIYIYIYFFFFYFYVGAWIGLNKGKIKLMYYPLQECQKMCRYG